MGNSASVRKKLPAAVAKQLGIRAIFGGEIDLIAKDYGDGLRPHVVKDLVDDVLLKASEVEGLFRVPANEAVIQSLIATANAEHRLDRNLLASDPHASDALLKRFFAQLRTALIPSHVEPKLIAARKVGAAEVHAVLLGELTEAAFATLALVVRGLAKLAALSSVNRMTSANIAVCWSVALFRADEAGDMSSVLRIRDRIDVITFLIDNAAVVFPVPHPGAVVSRLPLETHNALQRRGSRLSLRLSVLPPPPSAQFEQRAQTTDNVAAADADTASQATVGSARPRPQSARASLRALAAFGDVLPAPSRPGSTSSTPVPPADSASNAGADIQPGLSRRSSLSRADSKALASRTASMLLPEPPAQVSKPLPTPPVAVATPLAVTVTVADAAPALNSAAPAVTAAQRPRSQSAPRSRSTSGVRNADPTSAAALAARSDTAAGDERPRSLAVPLAVAKALTAAAARGRSGTAPLVSPLPRPGEAAAASTTAAGASTDAAAQRMAALQKLRKTAPSPLQFPDEIASGAPVVIAVPAYMAHAAAAAAAAALVPEPPGGVRINRRTRKLLHPISEQDLRAVQSSRQQSTVAGERVVATLAEEQSMSSAAPQRGVPIATSSTVSTGAVTGSGAVAEAVHAELQQLRVSTNALQSSNEQLRVSNDHLLHTMERLQQRLLELTRDYQASEVERYKLAAETQALRTQLSSTEQQLELLKFRSDVASAMQGAGPTAATTQPVAKPAATPVMSAPSSTAVAMARADTAPLERPLAPELHTHEAGLPLSSTATADSVAESSYRTLQQQQQQHPVGRGAPPRFASATAWSVDSEADEAMPGATEMAVAPVPMRASVGTAPTGGAGRAAMRASISVLNQQLTQVPSLRGGDSRAAVQSQFY